MDEFRMLPLQNQQDLVNDPRFIVNGATVGASGAIFGCLAAMGYLFPNSLIYLYFFVPIKVKWFVLGYAALELFAVMPIPLVPSVPVTLPLAVMVSAPVP